MNIAYGMYLTDVYSEKQIYNCILSLKSVFKFIKKLISKVFIYTNSVEKIKNIFLEYFTEKEFLKIFFIETTDFVETIASLANGANKYLSAGIFYRLQILSEIDDVLYLDNDVIINSKKFKIPKTEGLNKTHYDSSCICYSKYRMNTKHLLYYISFFKDHIWTLQYPDECIIHDGFPFLEKKFKYDFVEHYGNTEYLEHNEFNENLFKELVRYLDTYNFKTEFDTGIFDPFFRKPRSSFMYKKQNQDFKDKSLNEFYSAVDEMS